MPPKAAPKLPRSRPRNRSVKSLWRCKSVAHSEFAFTSVANSTLLGLLRYTLDAATSALEFDPSDAKFLGKGAAASVYQGSLNGNLVAIKVGTQGVPKGYSRGSRLSSKPVGHKVAAACATRRSLCTASLDAPASQEQWTVPIRRAGLRPSGAVAVRTSQGTLPFAHTSLRLCLRSGTPWGVCYH
jgi:hypothetical protein